MAVSLKRRALCSMRGIMHNHAWKSSDQMKSVPSGRAGSRPHYLLRDSAEAGGAICDQRCGRDRRNAPGPTSKAALKRRVNDGKDL